MLASGIAWTPNGYDVVVTDEAGHPAAPAVSFTGGEITDLVAHLRKLADNAGQPISIALGSTNGVLDGYLLAAGLNVSRADPSLFAGHSADGSPTARLLAELARKNLGALAEVTTEGGFLLGRVPELDAGFALAKPIMAELAQQGRCVSHGPRDRAEVALTFDDGPHPAFTGQVLDILSRYEVPATFFCIGLSTQGLERQVAQIADLGHHLGNHTWSHPYLPDLSASALRDQVGMTRDKIASVTGEAPTLLRPPYGALTPEVLEWSHGLDETIVMWDVEAEDWGMPGPDAIAGRVLENTRPGSVVLLHDGGGDRSQTVQALPAIIEGCLERGLAFVTLPDLLV
jgi:peptidoglycan/xylan/chitin deacetylase (PgdA/CDA1 family)